MDEGQSCSSERQPRYMFDFTFNAVISFFFSFFLIDAAIKGKKKKGKSFVVQRDTNPGQLRPGLVLAGPDALWLPTFPP